MEILNKEGFDITQSGLVSNIILIRTFFFGSIESEHKSCPPSQDVLYVIHDIGLELLMVSSVVS